jgi:hypothetical protein
LKGARCLEPLLVIGVEAGLVVVDKHARRDVHGVDEAEPFANAAGGHELRHLRRDVAKGHPLGEREGQMLGVGFHDGGYSSPFDSGGRVAA